MEPCTSSGLQSADAVIMAAPGRLCGVRLLGDGTNAATLILYDNASAASGTVLAKVQLDAGATESPNDLPDSTVCVNNGIYADVTGTGAEYIVYFSRG